jgi:transcriptional antiterminator RfaH
VAYWCCAQLEPNRERLALHLLMQERFTVYAPRVRVWRIVRGRREDRELPLFPRYLFIEIVQQWYRARWCPGVVRLIMDGITPAKVPDAVIEEIRSRERNGLIELPKPRGLRRGDPVRVERGVFQGRLGLYDGQTARERVWVLLQLLGSQRRTELAAGDVVRGLAVTSPRWRKGILRR